MALKVRSTSTDVSGSTWWISAAGLKASSPVIVLHLQTVVMVTHTRSNGCSLGVSCTRGQNGAHPLAIAAAMAYADLPFARHMVRCSSFTCASIPEWLMRLRNVTVSP